MPSVTPLPRPPFHFGPALQELTTAYRMILNAADWKEHLYDPAIQYGETDLARAELGNILTAYSHLQNVLDALTKRQIELTQYVRDEEAVTLATHRDEMQRLANSPPHLPTP